jgi:hypothetical protein
MALVTNKTKRDLILAERVAAIGGTLIEVDSSKYGSDLTSYSLYMTFPDDEGPAISYRHRKELDAPYHAYRVIIKGGHDALDAITSNPAHLAIHAYRERQKFHWDTLRLDDLGTALEYAKERYQRSAVECEVARIRGIEDNKALACNTTDAQRLREAVQAYDAAHAAMVAVIGEWPKSDDNCYPHY